MPPKYETCFMCGKTFEWIGYPVRCGVKHPPGECCHYGQIEVPPDPNTLRT